MISLSVNGEARDLEVDAATPLLWVLRDTLGLTGTKYSCGIGGVRRVHRARGWRAGARLCHAAVGAVAGKSITYH